MNVKEYISSGILEEYVLGGLSDQERQEVECMSHIYPEISTALHEIEDDMFIVAQESAVTPPEFLKSKVMVAIDEAKEDDSAPVVSLSQQTQSKNPSGKGWRIAAVIALLVACGTTITLFMQQSVSEDRFVAAQNEIEVLKENVDSLKTQMAIAYSTNDTLNTQLAFIKNADVIDVRLGAVEGRDSTSSVMVYWNQSSGDAYVQVLNLPEPPSDKQYQLWGLVDGQPVDMGVFDMKDADSLQLMKGLKGAQVFAITLEQKGGSPTPTLEEMYVLGKIAG